MNETIAEKVLSAKQTTKPTEGARRVVTLYFRDGGGVDLPSEQRQARLQTAVVRPDKPRYEVVFVARDGMYYVREYTPWKAGEKPDAPRGALVREFVIPREWALAELEPL